jgi:hypothetical protein
VEALELNSLSAAEPRPSSSSLWAVVRDVYLNSRYLGRPPMIATCAHFIHTPSSSGLLLGCRRLT